jgi:hypothetical protein
VRNRIKLRLYGTAGHVPAAGWPAPLALKPSVWRCLPLAVAVALTVWRRTLRLRAAEQLP